LPQHGFARVSRWKWAGVTVDHIQQLTISFSLTPEAIPASQRTLWPFDFRLVYNVTLSANTLKTELVISNTGNVPFNFTCLFHTYLLCQTDHVVVYGLDGATRKDNGSDSFVADHRPMITIDGHVDALFRNSNRYISVAGCNLVIDNGLDNVVLWNPWVEKAKEMSDFGDLEFKNMLCVECGKVDEPVALNSGCIFNASQTLIALP
jgi:glucose-6-phosphate 1-epimerase